MRALVVATCLSLIITACAREVRPSRLRAHHATCEATCDYYQYCRGANEQGPYDACLVDCRSIFSEDGQVDTDSLLNLQRLECSALLSFIEGNEKRALGSSEI